MYKQIFYIILLSINLIVINSKIVSENNTEIEHTCLDNLCIPKCCDIDEVFSTTLMKCIPWANSDLSWLPTIKSANPKETVLKILSHNDHTVELDIKNDEENIMKMGFVYPRWPYCEHYGPDDEKTDGYILTDGRYYAKKSKEFVLPEHYCIDITVHKSELPLDYKIEKNSNETTVLLVTCFEAYVKSTYDITKEYLLVIGLIISIISLVILLILMIYIRSSKRLQGLILISHAVSLLVSDILLILNRTSSHDWTDVPCLLLGIAMHYSFLATFFWLNVMCYDIMKSVKMKSSTDSLSVSSDHKKYRLYCCYAWGCPLIIVGLSVIIHFLPNELVSENLIPPKYAVTTCWIMGDTMTMILYFYGIIAILLSINFIFVVITVWHLKKAGISFSCALICCRPCNDKTYNSQVDMFWHRFLIFVMMILCWMTEFISWLFPLDGVWLITDVINTLQGFVLLVIFLLHPDNRKKILGRKTIEQEDSNNITNIYSLNA